MARAMKRYILFLIIIILLSCCDRVECPTCTDLKLVEFEERNQCFKMIGNRMIRVQCGVDTVYTGDK